MTERYANARGRQRIWDAPAARGVIRSRTHAVGGAPPSRRLGGGGAAAGSAVRVLGSPFGEYSARLARPAPFLLERCEPPRRRRYDRIVPVKWVRRCPCSADFPVCCVAGLPACVASHFSECSGLTTPRRFGNRRHSRLGSLRHALCARRQRFCRAAGLMFGEPPADSKRPQISDSTVAGSHLRWS